MLLLVALGGNAVGRPGEEGNIPQQFAATRAAMRPVADLILAGHRVVITHGNGPQVGNTLRRIEIAAQHKIYPLPLDIVVADTEAGMGYMISQCLMNEFVIRGKSHLCTTIITTVCVDPNDPAFKKPEKPVGPFMTKEAAQLHVEQDKWQVVEDSGRGWRRVVPSPLPREIVELPLMRTLVESGQTIVAAGGGGIPVMRDSAGHYKGVEAVIDKDRTSALLAAQLGADQFVVLTAVDQVQKDFNKPSAQSIAQMTATEAKALLDAGQFPAGSMAPKIQAAIDFLQRASCADPQVLITSCERAAEAIEGKTGTRIIRG